jgi:hypothetical protein
LRCTLDASPQRLDIISKMPPRISPAASSSMFDCTISF